MTSRHAGDRAAVRRHRPRAGARAARPGRHGRPAERASLGGAAHQPRAPVPRAGRLPPGGRGDACLRTSRSRAGSRRRHRGRRRWCAAAAPASTRSRPRSAPRARSSSCCATRLDRPGLQVAVALGRPRVNRKPVLQLIDADGTTVGFGKVGIDEHTDELVRRGRAGSSPRSGGAHPPLLLPDALLDRDLARPPAARPQRPRRRARRHRCARRDRRRDLRDRRARSDRARHRRSRASGGGASSSASPSCPSPTGPLLRRCRDHAHEVLDAGDDHPWPFGQWHGDLARWNAVERDGSLVVWDWERSAGPVPVGLDAVHAHFQPPLLKRRPHRPEVRVAGAGRRRSASSPSSATPDVRTPS